MSHVKSGWHERLPYSLSRYTDVPAAKWDWFKTQRKAGEMIAIDPRNAIPCRWSLKPKDTLGLVFWTKDPTNLLFDAPWLQDYRVKVHITATGWEEVEKGAPSLVRGASLLGVAVGRFGPENVVWRFSPVPMVPDVVERFDRILLIAAAWGVTEVFVSFLQTNDLVPETRTDDKRFTLLLDLGERARAHKVRIRLCAEDRLLSNPGFPSPAVLGRLGVSSGICAPPEDFDVPGLKKSPAEGCGCALAVDAFTINESCTFGCQYCYAADKTLLPKKRNTTPHRKLLVLR